jgi:hypothetical protein
MNLIYREREEAWSVLNCVVPMASIVVIIYTKKLKNSFK